MSQPPPNSDAAVFLQSLQDPEIIERVRCTIKNAHVFKLPPRQSASVGWRGADWKEKVWQGTVKVVERGDLTAALLVDRSKGSIFAVCPIKEGAVDRCVDSSRYFVLRIENANGRHMFIGVAFNERNDAFDFNTSLEDSRRERELEKNPVKAYTGPPKDYSMKAGEKIKVSLPKGHHHSDKKHSSSKKEGKKRSFLRPSSKDTPARDGAPPAALPPPPADRTRSGHDHGEAAPLDNFFSSAGFEDDFATSGFSGNNFFNTPADDQTTFSSNPFFKSSEGSKRQETFDPRNYRTKSGR